MKHKPVIIVLGEPFSIFSEILFKSLRKIKKNFKKPILLIGSKNLLEKQMKKLNFSFKISKIDLKNSKIYNLNKKNINIIDVDLKFLKTFDKISFRSKKYIKKCFDIAILLLKNKEADCIINGPISKKHFLKKKYPGITEYLSNKFGVKNKETMLIFNEKLSVSPITTHLPLKKVHKSITKKKIKNNILQIIKFYKNFFNKKPIIAVLGLNPHCETTDSFNEEKKIIYPAIKSLNKNNIKVHGPFSADTFFLKKNIKRFDVVIGMYHDQVLTPIKTIYNFNAINITLGLPFLRISPDHGPNNKMIGLNKSNPQSLISSFKFINKFK